MEEITDTDIKTKSPRLMPWGESIYLKSQVGEKKMKIKSEKSIFENKIFVNSLKVIALLLGIFWFFYLVHCFNYC